DEIESVCGIALAADHLSGSESQELDVFSQTVDKIISQTGKDRYGAEVAIESALAVGAIELRAETLVALHDVENVAQHLEHRAIGLSLNGGRARIQTHARHFSAEVAGTERCDGVVVTQIKRCVDVNPMLVFFFIARIVLTLRYPAGKFAKELANR